MLRNQLTSTFPANLGPMLKSITSCSPRIQLR